MEVDGKRLLVIGGAGLIGSHLVDQLTKTRAAEIVVFDNFQRGRPENLKEALRDPRVSIFAQGGDIQHSDILERAMEGVDGVFHLAALWLLHCHEYPRSAFDVNIRGTFNVIEAAIKAGVKRVVYSSSASVYGDAVDLPMTEDHPYNNNTFYGATKIAGEHMFRSLGQRYGLDWVGLRYMNVYGPRQEGGLIVSVLRRIESGEPPVIQGDGSASFDFVHVADVARLNVAAMASEVSGDAFNVGSGGEASVREIVEQLLELTGSELEPRYDEEAKVLMARRVGSNARAEEKLGWQPAIDLETGLAEVIAFERSKAGSARA
jgi:UDP-glucose 4-epimerase